MLDPLELVLQEVVSQSTWVLRTKLRSSTRETSALSYRGICPSSLKLTFFFFFFEKP